MFLIYFTQANVPQITRHLAVCRQFNFNYDIFVIHFCKYKDFAKILFLPPLANNKTGNVVSGKSFCLAFFKKLAEFETESQGFKKISTNSNFGLSNRLYFGKFAKKLK